MSIVAKKGPKRPKPIPPAEMSWPDKLRALQAHLGLKTQQGLADKLGISLDTLKSWLYRGQEPSQIALNYVNHLLDS